MKHRITAFTVAALLGTAWPAWASLDCADYISGYIGGSPLTGQLLGEQLVTEVVDVGFSGGVRGGVTETTQYRVGYYRMSNGTTLRVDCRTYTAI